ncbi:MAG: GTPase ObgE [Candidatus Aerophobetes bacterium]|nr:GTPase ObgE [Candidatus Aerophobetes bacterium]
MSYFIDEVKIYVKSGDGGNGCMSFRRERGVPRGGPNGGDGGDGGDVILRVDKGLSTLSFFYRKIHFFAQDGEHGKGKNKEGKRGENLVLKVPPGTLVKDETRGKVFADLKEEGDFFLVARGGKGGRGNSRFKTSTHRAPRKAEPGGRGEERWLNLELKLIADVGIIGFPNAGKSTLISRVSNAHPKIASYPFTTLIPHLGIVIVDEKTSFVVADLPGLIEGASSGKGLGDRFLRHIERSKVLLHLIDVGTSHFEGPAVRFEKLNEELRIYSPVLFEKSQLIVANKMDLPGAEARFLKLKKDLGKKYPIVAISALKGEGLRELLISILNLLKSEEKEN